MNCKHESEPGLRTHLLFKAVVGQSVKTAGEGQASACLHTTINGSYRLLAFNGIYMHTAIREIPQFERVPFTLELLEFEWTARTCNFEGVSLYLHFTIALLCKSASVYI